MVSSRGVGKQTDWASTEETQPHKQTAKTCGTIAGGRRRFDGTKVAWRLARFMIELVIEQKLFGIDQRPQQILEILAGCFLCIDRLSGSINARLTEIILGGLDLIGVGSRE